MTRPSDDTLVRPVRVLGVSASPRRGATYRMVRRALDGAARGADAATTFVDLSGKRITPCSGCQACLEAGACVVDDDMTPLYDELLRADAVLLGTPVYFGSASALCHAFMERVEGLGVREKRLRLKVGGALAIGASPNGGQETAMAAIHLWFHINEMLPVGITAPVSQWGPSGQAGHALDDIERDVIELKLTGRRIRSLDVAAMYGLKLARVAQIVRAGVAATGLDIPHRPYGYDLAEEPVPPSAGD